MVYRALYHHDYCLALYYSIIDAGLLRSTTACGHHAIRHTLALWGMPAQAVAPYGLDDYPSMDIPLYVSRTLPPKGDTSQPVSMRAVSVMALHTALTAALGLPPVSHGCGSALHTASAPTIEGQT